MVLPAKEPISGAVVSDDDEDIGFVMVPVSAIGADELEWVLKYINASNDGIITLSFDHIKDLLELPEGAEDIKPSVVEKAFSASLNNGGRLVASRSGKRNYKVKLLTADEWELEQEKRKERYAKSNTKQKERREEEKQQAEKQDNKNKKGNK